MFLIMLHLGVLDERGDISQGRRKLTRNHIKASHVREAQSPMVQIHVCS